MIRYTGLTVVALVVIAAVAWSWVRDLRRGRSLTHPLAPVAGLYGRALVLYVAASAYWLSRGFASGGSRRGSACVDTGFPAGGAACRVMQRGPEPCSAPPGTFRPARCIRVAQWALFFSTKIPDVALWGFLAAACLAARQPGRPDRAVYGTNRRRHAAAWLGGRRRQPDCRSPRRARRRPAHQNADDPATYSGPGVAVDVLIYAPLRALLPVPALAGAALLTFARITQAGAVMDEEIKATVWWRLRRAAQPAHPGSAPIPGHSDSPRRAAQPARHDADPAVGTRRDHRREPVHPKERPGEGDQVGTLAALCAELGCQPGDLLSYQPELVLHGDPDDT